MSVAQLSNYGDRLHLTTDFVVLPSAARTANTNSALYQPDAGNRIIARGMHLIINVTAILAASSIVISIEAFEGQEAVIFYPVLTSPAITTTGFTVLKIFPGIEAVPNLSANDFLPNSWRVTSTVANANSITFSAAAKLFT